MRTLIEGPLGIKQTDQQAKQTEAILKTLPPERRKLYRKTDIAQTDLIQGERADISIVSTDSVDAQSEVVLAKNMDIATIFQRNPVVLFGHQYDRPPVGRAAWVRKLPNGLRGKTVYAERPEDWQGEWFPDMCYQLVRQQILKGKSIGFLANEIREATPDELAIRPEWKGCPIISSATLLEWSLCAIPCNPDALVEQVSKGLLDDRVLDLLGMKRVKPIRVPVIYDLEEALKQLDPNVIARNALRLLKL